MYQRAPFVGVHQAAVDAARAASVDALRAISAQSFNARRAAFESRAAAGLVSVSTSGFDVLPSSMWMAENSIVIDPAQARVTRLRKAVGVGAKWLLNDGEGVGVNNVMVTLTYDTKRALEGSEGSHSYWQPRHVSDYVRCVRKWFADRCPGQKLRYVWVAELQKRGVLHYHCVFFLPAGVSMPWADKKGWWAHGSVNTLKATAPVAYLMKYASKPDSKSIKGFPHGARISAVGGLSVDGRAFKRWCLWPAYVQGNASVQDVFKPAEGGGYRNAATGEVLLSEYAPTGGGFTRFVRIRTTPRQIEASGPFSWAPTHTNSAVAEPAVYLH